jgi:hypothetical protein
MIAATSAAIALDSAKGGVMLKSEGYDVAVVGAGSGQRFKYGPEVGRYAAQLLLGTLSKVEPRFSLGSKGSVQDRAVH